MRDEQLVILEQRRWEQIKQDLSSRHTLNSHLHCLLSATSLIPRPIKKGIWPFGRILCPECGCKLLITTTRETGYGFVTWHHHNTTTSCGYEFAGINKTKNTIVGFPNMEP